MILYYALGGGLGHITRTYAILSNLPDIAQHTIILASSVHAKLTLPFAPCKIKIIGQRPFLSKNAYLDFINDFINHHKIKLIILDAFPFGLLREFTHLLPKIPRILIARYLHWKEYAKGIDLKTAICPGHTLIIEPLERLYLDWLLGESNLHFLQGPILLENTFEKTVDHIEPDCESNCLIVHSGHLDELTVLRNIAKKIVGKCRSSLSSIYEITPEKEIFPAEYLFQHFNTIISGAGYNMAANAISCPPSRRHILFPFKRRFDNQFFRIERMNQGKWLSSKEDGTKEAAAWLKDIVARLL